MRSPGDFFHHHRYLRSNLRRMEHLAVLNLPVESRSVLEIGAGIGDLTSFFLDRDCAVTSVEPREENVAYFRQRYADDPLWPSERLRIVQSDIEHLPEHDVGLHDIVFSYGVLNEIDDPLRALQIFSDHCGEFLILEVAVSSGLDREEDAVHFGSIDPEDLRASISGRTCVPTRPWIFNRLKEHFEHVYMTRTQPLFDRYRFDWRTPATERTRHRSIFIASRSPLENAQLVETIPDMFFRHTV